MAGLIGFTRAQFNALDNLLTHILQRLTSVEGVTTQATEQAIGDYVETHGVRLATQVTDGNLTITIL